MYGLDQDGGKIIAQLINEGAYAASSSLTYDYSASTNPAAAMTAVQCGALFTGKLDVVCKEVPFFWTKCDPPSGVHVTAYFSAN